MKSVNNTHELFKFEYLLHSIVPGNVYFVTGKNGSGKSRFFAYATKEIRQSRLNVSGVYGRLLCLSGTMHDKYPPIVYKEKAPSEDSVYLGNKVNNNMVSDTAPFRVLCYYMLSGINLSVTGDAVDKTLRRLSFEKKIGFKFRYGKSRKAEVFGSIHPYLEIDLSDLPVNNVLVKGYIEHLVAGDILLADVIFFRGGQPYGLSDLSSGEKQYVLALLGVIYCGGEGCTVFYDEPENSLHPSWQLSIVKDLAKIVGDLHPGSTLVVATHSPLIASSVQNGGVYVCDLPAGQVWQRSDLYGRASDTVLREQFHLYSARSPEVAALINSCLALISRSEMDREQFQQQQAELRSYNLELTPDDPLHEVVATILGF